LIITIICKTRYQFCPKVKNMCKIGIFGIGLFKYLMITTHSNFLLQIAMRLCPSRVYPALPLVMFLTTVLVLPAV